MIFIRSSILAAGFLMAFSASAQNAYSYFLNGTHAQFGPYTGELEIRENADETLDVVRAVTYRDFRFDGLQVQEVWAGKGAAWNGQLNVKFSLKKADVFNRVDGTVRAREQFSDAAVFSYAISLTDEGSRIQTPTGEIIEQVVPGAHAAGARPLWTSERRLLPSFGDSHQAIGKIAWATIFRPIMKKFENDPFVRSFANRPECQDVNQYFVLDPTDFDFLRANPDVVRVANKIVDPISLTEETLRHDAYAPTLSQKADAFDDDVASNHINELGLYSTALFDRDGRLTGFAANGDGALWSGMYAGAQAMRYVATKDPRALENFKRVTKGLMLLMDLTGDPNEFARTAEIMKPGDVLTRPWRQGVAPYAHVKYIEGGNNDMIKGLFHAFAWAYEILPADDELLLEVSKHAVRLPQLKPAKEISHVGNKAMATALAYIATGDPAWLAKAESAFKWGVRPADIAQLDHGFYYGGVADWSGINLGAVSNSSQVLIYRRVLEKNPGRPLELEMARHARRNLMELWSVYSSARRDFVTVAADAFGLRDDGQPLSLATRPMSWPKQDIWTEKRDLAVWLLREVPAIRVRHDIGFDFSMRPDFCLSKWPHLPWKSLTKEKPPMAFYYQAQVQMPLFHSAALESDNMWTGAFGYIGGASKNARHGRIDYLHTYWMARFSGLVSAAE